MPWRCVLALLLVSCAGARASELSVRERQGRLDVAVKGAPLADVLDHLARRTGMKVVYEGHAPRQLVTLTLAGRSPAEVVAALLEGQGLDYALLLDASATRVETLLVTTASARTAAARSAARPAPIVEEPPDDVAGEEPEEPVAPLVNAPAPSRPTTAPPTTEGAAEPTQPQATATPPLPVVAPNSTLVPLIPNPAYPSSTFGPRPVPMDPRPQPTPSPTPPPKNP